MLKPFYPLCRAFAATFLAFAASISFAGEAHAGVSLSIGEPGFYGRIDIGGHSPPALIYPYPVIVTPTSVVRPPIYLYVPHRHVKNWRRHCRHYGACNEQVYFVRDSWYRHEYMPHHTAYRLAPLPSPHVYYYHEQWRHHHMHDGYRWRGYRHLPPPLHRHHDDDDDDDD